MDGRNFPQLQLVWQGYPVLLSRQGTSSFFHVHLFPKEQRGSLRLRPSESREEWGCSFQTGMESELALGHWSQVLEDYPAPWSKR